MRKKQTESSTAKSNKERISRKLPLKRPRTNVKRKSIVTSSMLAPEIDDGGSDTLNTVVDEHNSSDGKDKQSKVSVHKSRQGQPFTTEISSSYSHVLI